MTEKVFVVEISPVVSIDGSTQQFLFGTRAFATGPADTPANTPVRPFLKNPGSLRRELFSGARVTGAITPSYGNIVLANMAPTEDAAGELDDWIGYGLSGSKIIVRYGEIGAAYPSAWTTVYIAYAQSFVADLNEITIRLRDRLQLFDQPIVVDGFNGSGGLEGTVSAAKKKQFVAGFCPFVPAVLIDEAKQIYFAQSTAPYTYDLTDNFFVYDNGVGIAKQANYQTSDDLLNVAPEAGYCRFYFGNSSVYTTYDLVYDPATRTFKVAPDVQGATRRYPHRNGPVYFRLGSPPAGDIRILTYGAPSDLDYYNGGANVAVGQFTAATFATRVGINIADVDASASTLIVTGRYVSDNSTYLDVMADQCLASQGWFGFTRLDKLRAGLLKDPTEEPSTSQYEFTLANIQGLRREPVNGMETPVWKVSVRAGKTYPSQVANGANAAIKDYLTRDVWNSFQGVSTTTLLQNPGAIASSFEIQGRDFLLQEQIESFLQRYFLLYGGRRDFFTFTTPMTEETLALELHDVVTLKTPRFGLSAGKKFRIVGIEIQCAATKGPAIKFTLWGGEMGILTGYDGGPGSRDYSAPSIIDPLILQEYLGNFDGLFIADVKLPSDTLSLIGNFDGPFIGIIGGTAADCDNDFDKVVLLLHCDGANMATTFTDSSSYAKAVTASGNAQISTAQSRFGGASGLFDGDGDRLSVASMETLGTSDFTIEFWVNLNATSSSQKGILGNSLTTPYWFIGKNTVNKIFGTFNGTSLNADAAMTPGIWYHVAFVRQSNTVKLYINGVINDVVAGITDSTNYTQPTTLYIGGYNTTNADSFNGYIDDLRITKGVARYVVDFTPPSAAFADVACTDQYFADVVFMTNMQGAVGSQNITDQSSLNSTGNVYFTGTKETNAGFVTTNKLFGTTCWRHAYQQTASLSNVMVWFPSRTEYTFTGDFTIELWIYINSITSSTRRIMQGSVSGNTNRKWCVLIQNNDLTFFSASGELNKTQSIGTTNAQQWVHLAICRSNNTLYTFNNGSLVTSSSVSGSLSQFELQLFGNRDTGGGLPNEWLQNDDRVQSIRLTKVARYTSSFTPPSALFPSA